MKFKMTMVATVVALAGTNLYAQETYSVEAVGATSNITTDDQSKQTGTQLAAAFYLKPIKLDSTQPYSELAFLQKASTISLTYANLSSEDAIFTNTTITPLQITGTLIIDKLILGLSTSNWNSDFKFKADSARYYGIKSGTTGFQVGYYVTPEAAITFSNGKTTNSFTPSSGLAAVGDTVSTTNSIRSQTVSSLGGSQFMRIDLQYNMITREPAATASQKNNEYGIDLRYYPETKYFVGGGYLANSGDRDYTKGKTMSVTAGYTFTPRLGVGLLASKFTGDVSTEQSSSNSTSFFLGYRF
jgi:hypothetical protein